MYKVFFVSACVCLMTTTVFAATPLQIAPANLQVYLPMNGNLNDASGKGNHGILHDGVDGGMSFASGMVGQALDLEITTAGLNNREEIRAADNDHIIINYGLADSGTIAMWYKTGAYWHRGDTLWDTDYQQGSGIAVTDSAYNSNDRWECWMYEGATTDQSVDARAAEGAAEGIEWKKPDSYVKSGPPMQLETWYHVALTWEKLDEQVLGGDPEHLYDAVELKLYINGVLVDSSSAHPWRDPGEVLFLGGGNPAKNSSGSRFDNSPGIGMWDEVAVWDTVLDVSQISQLFGFYPGDANCDGTVDADDSAALAEHWLQDKANWDNGDFNGDNIVDDLDAAILAANWGKTSSAAAVPEPATMLYLAALALAFAAYRRSSK